ncbi:MAG: hypothetical protein IPO58_10600 [Betaproteobacteria bacterium]|nr:hypothetical protein [Betaproteobacteria bacterium]
MLRTHHLLAACIAAAAVLSGSAGASGVKADPRASPASAKASYGVIESIAVDQSPPMPPGTAAPVGGGAAAADVGTPAPRSPRFVFRVRLDDGRYQGFHQDGGDELRVGDRVQIEIDRLRRVQAQGKSAK